MSTIADIERAIEQLSPEELQSFRHGSPSDAAEWDRQSEADVTARRLDALGEQALAEMRDKLFACSGRLCRASHTRHETLSVSCRRRLVISMGYFNHPIRRGAARKARLEYLEPSRDVCVADWKRCNLSVRPAAESSAAFVIDHHAGKIGLFPIEQNSRKR